MARDSRTSFHSMSMFFSADNAESAASLGALEALAWGHPALEIRLGHQSRDLHTASGASTALTDVP